MKNETIVSAPILEGRSQMLCLSALTGLHVLYRQRFAGRPSYRELVRRPRIGPQSLRPVGWRLFLSVVGVHAAPADMRDVQPTLSPLTSLGGLPLPSH